MWGVCNPGCLVWVHAGIVDSGAGVWVPAFQMEGTGLWLRSTVWTSYMELVRIRAHSTVESPQVDPMWTSDPLDSRRHPGQR